MSEITVAQLVEQKKLRVEDGNHGNDRPRSHEFVDLGVSFIRAADMTSGKVDFANSEKINATAFNRIRKGVGAPGDVLVTHKGTIGKVAFVNYDAPEFVCSPQTTFWRSLDQDYLNQSFIGYWLKSAEAQRQFAILGGQSDMAPYVSLTSQRSMTITVPEISRQRAIAEVLGALDDKIAANEILLSSMKSTMKAAASASTVRVRVGDISKRASKSVNPQAVDGDVEHFSLPAFDSGEVPENVVASSIKSNKFAIDSACVLVSKLNPRIPRIWNLPKLSDQVALASTEFVVLVPQGLSTSALWAALNTPAFFDEMRGKVAGTSGSHQRVKPQDILDAKIPDPRALDSLGRDMIDNLGLTETCVRAVNRQLARTRDELLPLLVSGKVTVKDAEAVVSDAV